MTHSVSPFKRFLYGIFLSVFLISLWQCTIIYNNHLRSSPKLLCVITTYSDQYEEPVLPVVETWAQRCDKYIFLSSKTLKGHPTIVIKGLNEDSYIVSQEKILKALDDVFMTYGAKYDWFVLTDDDTWLSIDNLKAFLSQYDSNQAIHFGRKVQSTEDQELISISAGMVMSKEALRRLYLTAKLHMRWICEGQQVLEITLGRCFQSLGVPADDALDPEGKHLFSLLHPSHPADSTLEEFLQHNHEYSSQSLSSTPVSFHFIAPPDMYLLEFLINYAILYGK